MLTKDICQRSIGKTFSIAGPLVLLTQLFIIQHTAFANLLSVKPKDSDVIISHPASFNCSSPNPDTIQWLRYDWRSPLNEILIYANGQFTRPHLKRFRLEKTDPSTISIVSLVIGSVQREDAGEYECREGEGKGSISSRATLTVLESIPVCESNASSSSELMGVDDCSVPSTDVVQLSCSVSYHGPKAPRLQWTELVDCSSGRSVVVLSTAEDAQGTDGAAAAAAAAGGGAGAAAVHSVTLSRRSIRSGSRYECRSVDSQLSTSAENGCSVGPFRVTGSGESSFVLVYIVVGVAAFCLLLVGVFCFTGGIFLQSRKPLRLFVSPDDDKRRRDELSEIKISPESKDESLAVWMEMAQSERKEKEHFKKELEQKTNEVEHLEMGKCRLENIFYSSDITSYADKPVVDGTLEIPDSKTKLITGMTILTKELFVTQEKLSEISVYNVNTLKFKRTIKPNPNNFDPLDLASCTKNDCLYMCITKNDGRSSKADILRFDKDGSLQKRWSVGSRSGGGTLSVCSRRNNCNVIVCLTEENEIQEFSCNGELRQTIRLHPSASILRPCHALKTTDRHFVVCHGNGGGGGGEDAAAAHHRVCAVTLDGVLLKSYGKKKGSDKQQMNRPIYLTEDANGNVLVADAKNNRILLLSSTLDFQRELISTTGNKSNAGLRIPNRICLDEERHRLLVGDSDAKKNNDCRVLVFSISSH